MMNNRSYYVTTPIFYPTGLPHIGTAYTVFIADTLARYHRKLGEDTFFLAGTDEHGGNIAQKAQQEGVSPQEYVDRFAEGFINCWKELGISNDYFVRTTDQKHIKFAQDLLQKSFDAGDIYPGTYSGWYCSSCEAYISEGDLIDGKCPNHPTKEPVFTEEKNYYFRWSKYQEWLLDLYERNPKFVQPDKWLAYVKDFVAQGLNDIPVTRANVSWGAKVPFDPEQTIYVWYDALPNYLSVLNFPGHEGFEEKYWPEAVHVIGKDIIKFHAILWPAMLKSAGYEPPRQVFTHGFFTVNGQKIGKSNDNAISPVDLSNKYGTDAVRYALLSEFRVGNDGDFSEERLVVKYNTELAGSWGNLLNRVIHLSITNRLTDFDAEEEFEKLVTSFTERYHQYMLEGEIFDALQAALELASYGNKYITDQKPWEAKEGEAIQVLSNLRYLLKELNDLYLPILPESASKAVKALDANEKVILFPRLE